MSTHKDWTWSYIFRRPPISLNNAYPTDKSGRRYPSPDLKAFKKGVSESLRLQDVRRGKPPFAPFYMATWVFCYPAANSLTQEQRKILKASPDGMFFKNGKLQKRDISNSFKAAEDTLFDYLGGESDDRQVLSLHGYKRIIPNNCGNKPVFLLFLSPEERHGVIYHGSQRIDLNEWAQRANNGRI